VIISVDSGLESALKTLTLALLGLTLLAGKVDRRARKSRRDPIAHTNIRPWWG